MPTTNGTGEHGEHAAAAEWVQDSAPLLAIAVSPSLVSPIDAHSFQGCSGNERWLLGPLQQRQHTV